MSLPTPPLSPIQCSPQATVSTSAPPSPQPSVTPINSPSQPPKRSPRKAALAAHQNISTCYAPALLSDSTDSDSSSPFTRRKGRKRHHSCRTPPTNQEHLSDSDSDEYIDDLDPGHSRSKRVCILQKRKRATSSQTKAETLGRADRELVAAAERRRLRGSSRFGRGNKRNTRVDEMICENVRYDIRVTGGCEEGGISAVGVAALNAVTEREVLQYCRELSMGGFAAAAVGLNG